MAWAQIFLGNFSGTNIKIKNNYGASGASVGVSIESNNNSTNESNVQSCEGIFPWQILEQKKVFIIYTEYATLSLKVKYHILFYVKHLQLFDKSCNGMGDVKRSKQHVNGLLCNECLNIIPYSIQNISQAIMDHDVTF